MNKYYRTSNGIYFRENGRETYLNVEHLEGVTFGGKHVFCEASFLTEVTPAEAIKAYDELAASERERILGMKPLDPEPWAFLDGYGRVGYRSYKPDFIRNPVFKPRPDYEQNQDYYA